MGLLFERRSAAADVRMPQLEGPALYEEAVRRYPGMRGRFIFIGALDGTRPPAAGCD
jgi:hypothetical protein